MISKVQEAVFSYLSNTLRDHGIPIEFRYDEDLDLLTGFRRSIQLRIENSPVFEEIVSKYAQTGKSVSNLGLFRRSPVTKSKLLGNNSALESVVRDHQGHGVEIRGAVYATVTFDVKLLFNTHEMSDIVELLYAEKFDSQSKHIYVTYDLGDDVESLDEVPYNLAFSSVSGVGALNESNLRYMDFSMEVTGPFFSQFYKEQLPITAAAIFLHVFDKNTDPIRPNATRDTFAWKTRLHKS